MEKSRRGDVDRFPSETYYYAAPPDLLTAVVAGASRDSEKFAIRASLVFLRLGLEIVELAEQRFILYPSREVGAVHLSSLPYKVSLNFLGVNTRSQNHNFVPENCCGFEVEFFDRFVHLFFFHFNYLFISKRLDILIGKV